MRIILAINEIEYLLDKLSGNEQFNAVQDFCVTRRYWEGWDENTRKHLRAAIPQFAKILTRGLDSNQKSMECYLNKGLEPSKN